MNVQCVPIPSHDSRPNVSRAESGSPPDYRFKIEVLAEGLPQPLELELAPDGRIFINEINGKLSEGF
jgi:glucose/arabinose dehydrogenase